LFVLTNISYIFFSRDVFTLFLWMLIIVAALRLLYILRKKLFWKVRNRLIFSGLFLVATPLLFLSIFFYFILNVIMAQYGMVIMDNLMNQQLSQLEKTAAFYLDQQTRETPFSIKMWKKIDPGFLNIASFERDKNTNPGMETGTGTFKNVSKSPKHFDIKGLIPEEFSGFFMLNDKLYHGCLKKNDTRAVLLCFIVNQAFLDQFAAISDFRMKYQSPLTDKTKAVFEVAADPELVNDDTFLTFPGLFKYKYLDFNEINNGKAMEKPGYFWLFLSFQKIYRKISKVGSETIKRDLKKLIYLMAFLFGTFIIISFFIGIRSIMVITRSINLISRGTERIRNGDFSFRIRTKSGDQLQYLGESFNEMAAGIDRLLVDEKEKQRLEEELRIARSIQLKLLPPDRFETEEFEIAAVNIPAAEIAGDYFDYFYKENDYLTVLVADVSGKGASAAFYMAELKGAINHLQKTEITPSALISECHDSLNDSFDRVTFITINLAKFSIPQRTFQLARAGHTPALFYSAEEKKCRELYPEGVAIGLINFSREKIKEIEVGYKKDDILFLFSDGLSEIMNSREEMLGMESLKEIITENCHLPAEEIKQKLLDFSITFSGSEVNRDDLTFIILKVKR
jgi:serine phosphatase RsbU (regulator of sigma subunit)